MTKPTLCTWTGKVSRDPSVLGNWLGGLMPRDGDSVLIPEYITQETFPMGELCPGVELARITNLSGRPKKGTVFE